MTKTAWISTGIFIVLLAVVLVFSLKPSSNARPELNIPGWGSGTADISNPEQDGPIDKLVITIGGHTITATRDTKNKKIWHLNKPATARADNYKLRAVINLFKDTIESDFSSKLSKKDIQAFGFAPDNVIHVILYRNGNKFADLDIGATQKKKQGDSTSADTWVRLAGNSRAFRILGKDLRRPFGNDPGRFRDRKVFAFDAGDISGVEITNPGAKDKRDLHIVLKSELKQQDKKAKSVKKPKRTWHISVPAGYRPGDISSYITRIADIYAQEFIENPPKDVNFDKSKAFKLKLSLEKGASKTLFVSGQYLQIDGSKELIKISDYASKGLRKGLSALRDRHVWSVLRETIKRVEIVTDKDKFVMEREGNKWKAITPKNFRIDENQRDRFLKDIEDLTVSDFKAPIHQAFPPSLRCILFMNDGHKLELTVGPKMKDGRHLARVTGVKDTLVISDYAISKLKNATKTLQKKTSQKKKK